MTTSKSKMHTLRKETEEVISSPLLLILGAPAFAEIYLSPIWSVHITQQTSCMYVPCSYHTWRLDARTLVSTARPAARLLTFSELLVRAPLLCVWHLTSKTWIHGPAPPPHCTAPCSEHQDLNTTHSSQDRTKHNTDYLSQYCSYCWEGGRVAGLAGRGAARLAGRGTGRPLYRYNNSSSLSEAISGICTVVRYKLKCRVTSSASPGTPSRCPPHNCRHSCACPPPASAAPPPPPRSSRPPGWARWG